MDFSICSASNLNACLSLVDSRLVAISTLNADWNFDFDEEAEFAVVGFRDSENCLDLESSTFISTLCDDVEIVEVSNDIVTISNDDLCLGAVLDEINGTEFVVSECSSEEDSQLFQVNGISNLIEEIVDDERDRDGDGNGGGGRSALEPVERGFAAMFAIMILIVSVVFIIKLDLIPERVKDFKLFRRNKHLNLLDDIPYELQFGKDGKEVGDKEGEVTKDNAENEDVTKSQTKTDELEARL